MARIKNYPHYNTVDRYSVRNGKWGAFIWDKERGVAVDLNGIVEKLNRCDFRTQQLRAYVERYGEVPLPKEPK